MQDEGNALAPSAGFFNNPPRSVFPEEGETVDKTRAKPDTILLVIPANAGIQRLCLSLFVVIFNQ